MANIEITGRIELNSLADRQRLPIPGLEGPRPAPLYAGLSSLTIADFRRNHGISEHFRNPAAYLYRVKDAQLLIGAGNDGAVLTNAGELINEPSCFTALTASLQHSYPFD